MLARATGQVYWLTQSLGYLYTVPPKDGVDIDKKGSKKGFAYIKRDVFI